ncbi:serine protein kinase [Aspergillus eucalypticola CBS 122712]|uniref:non-specific serine/threonine protein kinase n=1 Tax=Aspergillus eucalypticola (strain CBS 122712 / IBT 29274) TaxID=1448314 RepID=A0A317US90_ASPEC|nr:serine protein kinase [Aspergillus eucalypticola CBS 122712]PWY63312.1 serine protein kinase [Aspergillus eucalypticola CBS 122712]
MRRFERIYDVVEPVEEYRRGGYHPVHLHDVFHQRYEIIGKLAFGQYSTVWLAKDQKIDSQQVILKVLKAEESAHNRELSILLTLSDSEVEHAGKRHVTELLDYFYHTGPNGTHLCLVSPVMISDGEAMTISGNPQDAGYLRAISRQLLLGLDFLHQSGIVHCDLQPANILFSVAGTTDMEALLQPPEFSPVKWLEGVTEDESAPKYLMPTQRRRGQLSKAHFSTLEVRIGDLGGAQYVQRCDQKPVTPLGLRAPELIQQPTDDTAVATAIDIWTLGCLIFEFATNEPLFPLDTFGLTREEIDNDHLSFIEQRLGSNNQKDGDFRLYLEERLPENFGAGNVETLTSFLSLMLQKDPHERLPAKELLQTQFMTDENKT